MEYKKHQQSAATPNTVTGIPIDDSPSLNSYPNPNPNSNSNYAHYTANVTNPYVQVTPLPASKDKGPMDTIVKLVERCGRKLEESTRKANESAGNLWQHLRTSPSVYDAAMARLAQGTKVLAEGGIDKIFQQQFGILPGEHLRKSFACYISTSSGPVIGTLYVSTRRIAFCSDNPLCRYSSQGQQEWVYYKVVVQLDKLRAVNPSANIRNRADKYIQIVTVDNHELWFMGFVSYNKALQALTEALHHRHV